MEYRKYKEYWYKIIDESDFIYWKVSDRDGDDGNVFLADAFIYSLEECIQKMQRYDKYEDLCTKLIDEHGVATFVNIADLILNIKNNEEVGESN